MELWKTINDYNGWYQVSTLGNVRSIDRVITRHNNTTLFVQGRVLKPVKSRGYYYVRLCDSGRCQQVLLHRLVAQAFLPNPYNLPVVNHRDENTTNNCVNNLEWCTQQYNCTYGHRIDKFRRSIKGKLAGDKNPMYGKYGSRGFHHSDETKERLRQIALNKRWVTNGTMCKRIDANDVPYYMTLGWKLGKSLSRDT